MRTKLPAYVESFTPENRKLITFVLRVIWGCFPFIITIVLKSTSSRKSYIEFRFIELSYQFLAPKPDVRCRAVEAVVKPEVSVSHCEWVAIFR